MAKTTKRSTTKTRRAAAAARRSPAKHAAKNGAKTRATTRAKTAARATRAKASPRKRTAVAAKPARPPQRFTVSHTHSSTFEHGLRRYAQYRDLGIAAATSGLVQAHVIRMVPPFRPEEASTPHYHDVEFQMVYVLKGWYRTEFEGEGVHTFEAGSCWIQPPKIKHAVLGYSDDCELLEIVLPAEFATVTVDSV